MTLRLALLGDSIAAGQGAAGHADTPAARLTARLAEDGHVVTARVFAIPGARSNSLPHQVDRARPWAPHIAVIVIGANDLVRRTPPDQAARPLGEAVRRLRQAGAQVVVAPAPDLSTLPDAPDALRPMVRAASLQLRDRQVAAAVASGALIADQDHATAQAFADDPALFSADRFHPSSAGYAVIADALLPAVAQALAAHLRHGDDPRGRQQAV